MIAGTCWGAPRETMIMLYRVVVRSKMEYGKEAYLFGSKYNRKKMERIQSAGLRLCTGGMSSSPIASLQAACHEMPLEIRHRFLCGKYRCKLLHLHDHPWKEQLLNSTWEENWPKRHFVSFNKHSLTPTITSMKAPPRSETAQQIPPWLLLEAPVDTSLTTIDRKNLSLMPMCAYEYFNEKYEGYLKIFTDGSKSPKGVGAAFYVANIYSAAFKMNDRVSVYAAELYAIYIALEWIKKTRVTRVLILTDSLSAVQSIASCKHQSHHLIAMILNLIHLIMSS